MEERFRSPSAPMECRQSSCEPPGQFSPDTATVTRTHRQFVAGLLVLLVILLAGCGTPAPAVTAVTPTPVVDAVSPVAALVEGSDVEVPGSSPAPRPTQTPIHTPWPSSTASSTPTATPTVAPVSYTHLRAHETVLELVCRLLLEKKKRKQQNAQLRTSD